MRIPNLLRLFVPVLAVTAVTAVTSTRSAWGDMTVTPMGGALNANAMAAALLDASSGITINSASYTGANGASGTFEVGTDIIGIDRGILLTSGAVAIVPGPNDANDAGEDNGRPGDAQLDGLIPGGATQDASVLTIRFTPTGNQVRFSYVFASEEYNEYVGSEYNDLFAFFVGGTNYAVLPGTSTPVAINNVNCGTSTDLAADKLQLLHRQHERRAQHSDGRHDHRAHLHRAGESRRAEHHAAGDRRCQRRRL